MKRIILLLTLFLFYFGLFCSAADTGESYIFFYLSGCAHCNNVKTYFQENHIYDYYKIKEESIFDNVDYLKEYIAYMDEFNVSKDLKGSVPFLVISGENTKSFLFGDKYIIDYFLASSGVSNINAIISGNNNVSELKNINEKRSIGLRIFLVGLIIGLIAGVIVIIGLLIRIRKNK